MPRRVFTQEERAFRRRVGLEVEGETEEGRRERLAALLDEVDDDCDDILPLPLGEEDRRSLEQADAEFRKLLDAVSANASPSNTTSPSRSALSQRGFHVTAPRHRSRLLVGAFIAVAAAVALWLTSTKNQAMISDPTIVQGDPVVLQLRAVEHEGFAILSPDLREQLSDAQLEERCSRGDGESCGVLGRRLHGRNELGVLRIARIGCELGDESSCTVVAVVKAEGGDLAAGMKQLRTQCEHNNNAESCVALAHYYEFWPEVSDDAQAIKFLEMACSIDDGLCARMAIRIEANQPQRALALFKRACARAQGSYALAHVAACDHVGDHRRSAAILARRCNDRRDSVACYSLARRVEVGQGVPVDQAKATKLYVEACENEEPYALACARAGVAFGRGLGVSSDRGRALAYHERGCKLDDDVCTVLAAEIFDDDPHRAVELWKSNCKLGQQVACVDLGKLHRDGRWFERSHAQALALFQQACDQQNAEGCLNAGWLLYRSDQLSSDWALAATLFERGCDRDSFLACNNLGAMLEAGEGRPVAKSQALSLYRKGCADGEGAVDACENLSRLRARLQVD